MFTANSISVIAGVAVVFVSCVKLGQGAPAAASTLYWGPAQSQPNHWSPPLSDLVGDEKFPHEPPSEIKPNWLPALRYLSAEGKYPPVPSFDLQPPPLPPPAPLSTPKPDDQSSGEQVQNNDLEDHITQDPDLVTEEALEQDLEEQTTYQASEQVTEQVTTEVTGQTTEQAIEQVQNDEINSDRSNSDMLEKENGDTQPLSDSALVQSERTHLYEMFLNYMMFLERSAYVPKDWNSVKDLEISEPNTLWRLRRSAGGSDEYSDSGEESTDSFVQGSASAGSGQDIFGIDVPAFPTFEIFPQNQHQEYMPAVQSDFVQANFPLHSLGADGELSLQSGTGISARFAGPGQGISTGSSSSDDGNGKKTHSVYINHYNTK